MCRWYRTIQNYCRRKITFFSELIRRGVIEYGSKLLPQIIWFELIMRGNSVSRYVDRLFWVGMLWFWQMARFRQIAPKWLGEGAKGLLGQGSKSLKKGSCTTKTLFCTGATQHFTGAKGIWPDCTQRPFAPSPNHFGAISLNPAICQDHSFPSFGGKKLLQKI